MESSFTWRIQRHAERKMPRKPGFCFAHRAPSRCCACMPRAVRVHLWMLCCKREENLQPSRYLEPGRHGIGAPFKPKAWVGHSKDLAKRVGPSVSIFVESRWSDPPKPSA